MQMINFLADIDPNHISVTIMLVIYGGLLALVLIVLIRAAKFFSSATKEMKLTRIELGKLSEEVQVLQKKLKD